MTLTLTHGPLKPKTFVCRFSYIINQSLMKYGPWVCKISCYNIQYNIQYTILLTFNVAQQTCVQNTKTKKYTKKQYARWNARTDAQTHGSTDRQPKNIMPPHHRESCNSLHFLKQFFNNMKRHYPGRGPGSTTSCRVYWELTLKSTRFSALDRGCM